MLAGQHDATSRFNISKNGQLFLQSSFGTHPELTGNVPISTFPVTSLGAVSRWRATDEVALDVGVYEGEPGTERQNRFGLRYELGEGT